MADGVLLDWEGVLADTADSRREALRAAFCDEGLVFDELLKGDAQSAADSATRAIAADPSYTATYDLLGAAYTKLNQPTEARAAFQKSLSFDAHDSAAYTNLGLIDLAVGDRAAASNHFAEALWLAPESKTAREGLARAQAR